METATAPKTGLPLVRCTCCEEFVPAAWMRTPLGVCRDCVRWQAGEIATADRRRRGRRA